MGKLTGIIRFTGKLGGLSIYEMNGQHIVRQSYGPDAETIRKNPNYQGLKERNQEFGQVSRAAKMLRNAFTFLLTELGDKDVHHRLTQVFLAIKNLDMQSNKGHRLVDVGLQTTEGRNILSGFACRAAGRKDDAILSAGKEAIDRKVFSLNWSPELLLPKAGVEIWLDLVWIKADFANRKLASEAMARTKLSKDNEPVLIPMPETLEGKEGLLFLAIGVQYGRADGSEIGENQWKGLWIV
jgi:hypothetical protein